MRLKFHSNSFELVFTIGGNQSEDSLNLPTNYKFRGRNVLCQMMPNARNKMTVVVLLLAELFADISTSTTFVICYERRDCENKISF